MILTDQLINRLQQILISNDTNKPSVNSSRWKRIHDRRYKIVKGNKHFRVSEDLIRIIDRFTDICVKLKLDENDVLDMLPSPKDSIGTVYLLENDNSDNRCVLYTKYPLLTTIKLNMHKFNNNQDSFFDNFDDDDLRNFSFEVIEYVKYTDRKDLLERKKAHQALFESDNYIYNRANTNNTETKETIVGGLVKPVQSKEEIDKMYEKRIPIVMDVINQQHKQFRPFIGFIYKIQNIRNKRVFVLGMPEETSRTRIMDMIGDRSDRLQYDIERFGRRSFDVRLIETFHATTVFDFMFRVDYQRTKLDSLNKGYNDSYAIEESELLYGPNLLTRKRNQLTRSLFIKMQKYLFEKHLRDSTDYKDVYGFIYQINHRRSKKRFIGYAHNSRLKKAVMEHYDKALDGNVKQNKILKALSEEPYDSFSFTVMKKMKHGESMDLHGETEKLIERYDTVEKGFNNKVRGKAGGRAKKVQKPFWL